MSWSADTYLAFEAERSRPARDLVAAIPDPGCDTAIDLGCGPGNSTEILATRFPHATVEGLDSSPDMLAAARARLPAHRFTRGDIGSWNGQGPYGVILANAALHWLPDHATLLPQLIAKLAPGGSLAVQMPDNLDEPAHRLMRETARSGPWAETLAPIITAREKLQPPDWYFRILKPHAARVDVWRTTYHHPLSGGPAAIVDWFCGSGLRPYLAPLDPAAQAAYLAAYTDRLAPLYPPDAEGVVLLPFPRLFFVATR